MPKTGGTSLRFFLADQYLDGERCPAESWESLASLSLSGMYSFRLFCGHFSPNLRQHLPSGIKAMTFIREPVARTISTIRHMIRDPAFHPLHHLLRGRTLNEAIYEDRVIQALDNVQTKLLSFDVPIPQVLDYVRHQRSAGRVVDIGELDWKSDAEKAMRTLASYDFVGIMERFEDSLLAVCSEFNFVPPDVMPEMNKAADGNYPETLSAGDIDHIRSFLKEDIALYDMAQVQIGKAPNRLDIFSKLFSTSVLQLTSGCFEMDLGRPFSGSGWYDPEIQGDRLVRWSGPASKAMLYLPVDRRFSHCLQLTVLKPTNLKNIQVFVDGLLSTARTTTNGRVFNIEVELPARPSLEPQALITSIMLDYSGVSEPHHRNDGDLRTLGILLSRIAILKAPALN